MQHAMLASSLAQPAAGFDVVQVVIRTRERLVASTVKAAFEQLLARHPGLRLAFAWQGRPWPVAVVTPEVALPFEQQVLLAGALEGWLGREVSRPFSMHQAPLCRVALLELPEGEQALVWTVHHAVLDGGSLHVVLAQLQAALDGAPVQGAPAHLSGPEVLEQHLLRFDATKAQALWASALEGLSAPTRPVLWLDHASSERAHLGTSVDRATVCQLRALAESCQVSLNNVVQSAWGLALSAYSGEPKVSFGVTRAGRQGEPFADDAVGMFIGTVPLVVTVDPALTVVGLLRQVRDHWRSTRDFEHTPPADLHRWSGWTRGAPLFESVMVFDERRVVDVLREGHPAWARREVTLGGKSAVPLSLMVSGPDALELGLDFDPGCLPGSVAQALLATTAHLLAQLAAHPTGTVAELTWASQPAMVPAPAAEREAPLLLQRLRQHAVATPDAVAVEHRGAQLTYAQLWSFSRALALTLGERVPLSPGDAVVLVLERGLGLATAVWALHHLGVASVPVEPALLATQVPAAIGNSRVRCVLTSRALAGRVTPSGQPVAVLEELLAAPRPVERALGGPASERPAYVLYTSGSTGVAKGVEVSQRSLARYVQTCGPLSGARPGRRWLQLASLSFDISMEELFVTWGWGGTVVFKPEDTLQSVEQLELWLTALRIHAVSPPTALWHEWASRVNERSVVPVALEVVVIGGEAASMAAFARWERSSYRAVRLLNAYGPTEATISVTCFEAARSPEGSLARSLQRMPIGRPLEGVGALVVSANGQPAPVGAPGELWVSGEQVALGYSDQPELTAAAFVRHPALGRCFKTGDVVCQLPEGELAFLHRRDRQVKVRGFRVELAGLEAALLRHPSVTQAVFAQVADGGHPRLWAWVVLSAPAEVSALYAHLRARVASYALPEAIMAVDHLPTNASGKIDPAALPRPTGIPAAPALAPTSGPDDEVARGLLEVWTRLLPGLPISPGARLFEDLGVDSLTALLMLAEVQARFGCSLSVGVLARADTLESLADEIRARLGQPQVDHRYAVTLREQGALPPLFLVHGGDGHALAFRELVPRLDPRRPCIAFEAAAFDTATRPTLVAIAAAYRAELEQLQPRGPVSLAGFCLGGSIALEMATQLQRADREVKFLGLINTYAPGFPKLKPLAARIATAWRDGAISSRVRSVLERRLGLRAPEPETPLETLLNHAVDTWQPSGVSTGAHLFLGTSDPRWHEPPDLGWSAWFRGRLTVHPRLPIHHVHMLKGPYAVSLAEQLQAVLER